MPLTDSLVSHWKLNEASGNGLDAHGSHDLTDNNTVGATTGKLSGARDFEDSASERLSLAHHADFSPGDTDFTFTFWAWVDDWTVSFGFPCFLGKSGGNEYECTVAGSADIYWRLRNGATVATAIATFSSTATWAFVEVYHDSVGNEIGIRVNNAGLVTDPLTGGPATGSGEFTVGARGAGDLHFDGRIDSLSFWRRLLTSGERAALYNAGAGLDYPFSVGAALPVLLHGYRRRRV